MDAATRHLSNQVEATFTADLDSTLSTLPLYDGGLYERFGHDAYVRAEKRGEEAPYYMPPPHYWHNNAKAIRRIVLTDDLVRRLWTIHDGDAYQLVLQGVSKQMKHYWVYHGVNICSSLPSSSWAILEANAILYSAIHIELCRFAIGKPLSVARGIIRLCRIIKRTHLRHAVNPTTQTAIDSSNHAYSLVHDELQKQLLAEQKRKEQAKLCQVQLEKEHALRVTKFEQEKQLRILRASRASAG